MIQISSVTASVLPIPGDLQGESATEPTISAEFATLLAAQSLAVEPAPDAGAKQGLIQSPASEALPGKPGGKILPLPAMPVAALAGEIVTEPASDANALTAVPEAADQAAPSSDPAMVQLAILPIPFATAIPTAQFLAPPATESGGKQLAGSAPALKPAMPSAAPTSEPQVAASTQQSPLPNHAASIDGTPIALAASAKAPIEIRLPLTAPVLPSPSEAAAPGTDTATSVSQAPVAGSPAATASQARTAVELAGIRPKPGRPKAGELADTGSSSRLARPSSAGADTLPAIPAEPAAAQAVPVAPQGPGTATPVGAGAPAQPQNRIEAPADFSALVDRLVAAREAAQASVSPQAVHAAIAHAEFGQVSLRFEQQDGTLNVAMTSPDPDFARSALAAAPASQQGTDNSNSDNRGAPSRQDAGQPMSQPQAQTQGQANGQATHRSHHHHEQAAPQHRHRADAGTETTGGNQPARRRGIFA